MAQYYKHQLAENSTILLRKYNKDAIKKLRKTLGGEKDPQKALYQLFAFFTKEFPKLISQVEGIFWEGKLIDAEMAGRVMVADTKKFPEVFMGYHKHFGFL
jgi:hypothetical protein